MIICGTWFCVENKQKKTKTHPNTKFLPIFNGRDKYINYGFAAGHFWSWIIKHGYFSLLKQVQFAYTLFCDCLNYQLCKSSTSFNIKRLITSKVIRKNGINLLKNTTFKQWNCFPFEATINLKIKNKFLFFKKITTKHRTILRYFLLHIFWIMSNKCVCVLPKFIVPRKIKTTNNWINWQSEGNFKWLYACNHWLKKKILAASEIQSQHRLN